jgi:Bacterial SH3 domain.
VVSPAPTVVATTYEVAVDALNVRTEPSSKGKVVASYSRGEKVVLDGWGTYADGFLWGRYIGASSGQPRYVAIGTDSGSDWYLTMCR